MKNYPIEHAILQARSWIKDTLVIYIYIYIYIYIFQFNVHKCLDMNIYIILPTNTAKFILHTETTKLDIKLLIFT